MFKQAVFGKMRRSECPHLFTTRRGSNQHEYRLTCKQCHTLLQLERKTWRDSVEWESEEAFSQSTMLTEAASQGTIGQPVTAASLASAEVKWSKLACAYAAHAKAMARAEPVPAKRQLELMKAAKARQQRRIMLVLSVFCLLFLVIKNSEAVIEFRITLR